MHFRNKKQFAHNLFTISRLADDELVSVLSDELMLSFINFGSETPGNLNAFRHIDYGAVEDDTDYGYTTPWYGLRLKEKNILISGVFHSLVESLSLENVPDRWRQEYPEITPEEFQAVLRMTTMILLAFERHPYEPGEKDRIGAAYRE